MKQSPSPSNAKLMWWDEGTLALVCIGQLELAEQFGRYCTSVHQAMLDIVNGANQMNPPPGE